MAGNDKNEHDIIERRHHISVGPGVKAGIYFLSFAITFGAGWYICKQNTKGSIAESEVEVRKDDGKVATALDRDLETDRRRVEHATDETPYSTDCANMSIDIMRGGVQSTEEY